MKIWRIKNRRSKSFSVPELWITFAFNDDVTPGKKTFPLYKLTIKYNNWQAIIVDFRLLFTKNMASFLHWKSILIVHISNFIWNFIKYHPHLSPLSPGVKIQKRNNKWKYETVKSHSSIQFLHQKFIYDNAFWALSIFCSLLWHHRRNPGSQNIRVPVTLQLGSKYWECL